MQATGPVRELNLAKDQKYKVIQWESNSQATSFQPTSLTITPREAPVPVFSNVCSVSSDVFVFIGVCFSVSSDLLLDFPSYPHKHDKALWNFIVTIPAGWPHYLSFLKPLMASDSSSSFYHLWPGVFHIPLQIRKAQPRWWKKRINEQTQTWFNSKRKRWGVCDTFCAFCELTRARTRAKTLTKRLAMLTSFRIG